MQAMHTQLREATRPSDSATYLALVRVGALLGFRRVHHYHGTYHFAFGGGWSLAISPESAGRFRVEACRWGVPMDTLWAFADDDDRLGGVVLAVAEEIEAVRSGT